MPAPWTKRGRRQREAREDRGGDRADRSRGEEGGNAPRRSDRTLDDSKRRRECTPPLIVWRTCHQTETHSARRSLHKYWRTQKKRESTLFLGWLIPAGRRKIISNFERMLPTPRETDAFLPVTQKAISSRTVLRYSPFFFLTPSKQAVNLLP